MTDIRLFDEICQYLKADWTHFHGKTTAEKWKPSRAYRTAFSKLYFGRAQHSDTQVGALFDNIVEGAEAMVMSPEANITSRAKEMDLIIEPLEAIRPATVVDAGCGVGLTLGFLAKRWPQIHFIGYDISSRSIDRARQRIAHLGCQNVELFTASHEQAAKKIKDADFIFTENSYSNRLEEFAIGSQFRDIQAWMIFAVTDRTTQEYGMRLQWFAKMLISGGTYLCVQPMLGDQYAIFKVYSKIVGLLENEHLHRLLPNAPTRDSLGYERPMTDIMIFRKTGTINQDFISHLKPS